MSKIKHFHKWIERLPDVYVCSICQSARILYKNLDVNYDYDGFGQRIERSEDRLEERKQLLENSKVYSSSLKAPVTYLYSNVGYYKLNETSIEGNWVWEHPFCARYYDRELKEWLDPNEDRTPRPEHYDPPIEYEGT